mmetsp:Transcript_3243/g.4413  ORF Transcript_3243/g.4413 Transcript_3243/m.4413 type:complete len:408 (+) Transcript_3243:138-1361(+)
MAKKRSAVAIEMNNQMGSNNGDQKKELRESLPSLPKRSKRLPQGLKISRSLTARLNVQLIDKVFSFLGNRSASRVKATCQVFNDLGKRRQQFSYSSGKLITQGQLDEAVRTAKGLNNLEKCDSLEQKESANFVCAFLQRNATVTPSKIAEMFPNASIFGCYNGGVLGVNEEGSGTIEIEEEEDCLSGAAALTWGFIPDSTIKTILLSEMDLQADLKHVRKLLAEAQGAVNSWKGFVLCVPPLLSDSVEDFLRTLRHLQPLAKVCGGISTEGEVFGGHGGNITITGEQCALMCIAGRVDFDCITCRGKNVKPALERTKKSLNDAGKEVIASLLFTCCSRGEEFHLERHYESQQYWDQVGPAPINGMFAGGEIGPSSRRNDRHMLQGYTAVYGVFSIAQDLVCGRLSTR